MTYAAPIPPTQPPQQTQGKSTIAMVFGIINIAFGVLGFCFSPFNIVTVVAPPNGNPVSEQLQSEPWLVAYTIGSAVLGCLLAAVLIAAGIGLLQGRRWGRSLSLVYCWVAIALVVINLPVMLFGVFVPLLNQSGSNPDTMPGVVGGIIGGSCGMVFAFAYPVVLWVFMTRPTLKQALR